MNHLILSILVLLFLQFGTAGAQSLNVYELGTRNPSALVQSLMGSGISSFNNVAYSGTAWSSGTFTGGTGIIGLDSGILLSNGAAASAAGSYGSNPDDCNAVSPGLPGDPDLAGLAGVPPSDTHDATVLSFDFVPQYSNIVFEYVFASAEYNQYVGSYNDVFGLFINGMNAALVPGTQYNVSINNVNACQNAGYYVNNNTQTTNLGSCSLNLPSANLNTAMNGLTVVLTVNAVVIPGVANHVKLAICDVGDCGWDSNVFIAAHSFSSGLTATPTDSPTMIATPTPSPTPTRTSTPTPSFTPSETATITDTPAPCGYPGDTCTPTFTPTPTDTPPMADVFEVTRNILRPSQSVSIYVNYTVFPGKYELAVYNSVGEHIKTLDSRPINAPVSQWYSWDGKNKYNEDCASGLYILYLTEPEAAKARRLLLVR